MAFFESRNELLTGGILYPDSAFGWVKPGEFNHTELYRNLTALETARLPTAFDRLNASTYSTILISSEDLVSVSGQSQRYLKSLIAGRTVDVVFYCRRWSELLISLWQESVKQGNTRSLGEFVAVQLADPMQSSAINFDIVLGRYAEIFGIETIKLISYNHLMEAKVDLYDHFVRSILGLDDVPTVMRSTPNRSLDPVEIETVRLLHEIACMRSEPAGIDLFHRYWRKRSSERVSLLHAAMTSCLKSIRINDAAPGLRAVHDFIFEKYGRCMVEPNSGYSLFLPASRDLPYIEGSYIFAEGVMQTTIDLYEEICSM